MGGGGGWGKDAKKKKGGNFWDFEKILFKDQKIDNLEFFVKMNT